MAANDDGPALRPLHRLLSRYRITQAKGFSLKHHDPADTAHLNSDDKPEAREWLAAGIQWLGRQQDMLYAQDRWSLLVVLQAMDAAGKDSAIKHVMSGVNPQGVQVTSFKQPSSEELDHDFLWRCGKALPERGRIGIFNRSYYEDVLVVRVHPETLAAQKLPAELIGPKLWNQRHQDIRQFEQHLIRNGTVVLKFFLNVSRDEQKRRFLERIDEADKHWKFSAADVHEREHWDNYMAAYEDAIRATASATSPWFVVPADNKWFTRLIVVAAIVEALSALKLHYPQPDADRRAELDAARAELRRD
ncbi:MAG: polyphosphate kinase 2 family protein [Burkholderiaceae bacterium]